MIWTLENDVVHLGGTTHFPIPTYDAPFFVVAQQSLDDGSGLICRSCIFVLIHAIIFITTLCYLDFCIP